MSHAKPSPVLRRLLQWTTDSFYALRIAGFTDAEISRIISITLDDRLPPARPYPPEPEPRTDTEPPQ